MSAHDVRHLVVCPECKEMDDRRYMVSVPNQKLKKGEFLHGRCYIQRASVDALLRLDLDQLQKLTIGDVGPEIMRRIVETF